MRKQSFGFNILLELTVADGDKKKWAALIDKLGDHIGDAVDEFMSQEEIPVGMFALELKHKQPVKVTRKRSTGGRRK